MLRNGVTLGRPSRPTYAFISFAGSPGETDPKYSDIQGARDRLIGQANDSNLFADCIGLDWEQLASLCSYYGLELPSTIHRYLFTPIILKLITLGAFGRHDNYFYAGAGCEINRNFFARNDFHRMIKNSNKNILYVEHTLHPESMYTKKEVLQKLVINQLIIDSPQIMATFFVVSTCAHPPLLEAISSDWLKYALFDENSLINDQFERSNQYGNFKAHRNDQSIFSIILKNYGIWGQQERQRNFIRFLPGFRGSTTFLWTPRNRTPASLLPKGVNSELLGFLMFIISPIPKLIHFLRSKIRFSMQPRSGSLSR
jgi:hypothetical protein